MKNVFQRIFFFIGILCALPACAGAANGGGLKFVDGSEHVTVAAPGYSFDFNLKDGTWDAKWPDGKPFITRAYAVWQFSASESGGQGSAVISVGAKKPSKKLYPFIDPYGEGQALDVWFDAAAPRGRYGYSFRFYSDLPYFTVHCSVENRETGTIKVSAMTPLKLTAENEGGFFTGPDTAGDWILENGYNLYFDFFVRLVQANELVNSNWDLGINDPASGRSAAVGFVTVDHGMVSVLTFNTPDKRLTDAKSGWKAISGLRAVSDYSPSKPVGAGEKWTSETLLVMPDMKSPLRALETFADAAAAHYPMRPWTEPIPTGWNSWATGYHHALTQENMLQNAKWVRDNLLPYGMTTFQVDDGWQVGHGDWEGGQFFPKGMGWLAGQIKSLGLKPGLWIMPFCVSADSKLAKEHPDWLAPKNKMAKTTMPKDWEILDLTHPEVKQWLHDLFTKVSKEWGYKVIKIDFIYYALMAKSYYDDKSTNIEAFREAHRIIRDAIGDDAFLIDVSVPIYGALGYADGMRIGLDNTPDWQDDEGPYTQGLKPMVRNVARRYYLNHRTWINHPDMFYLGSPEEMQRWGKQLSAGEARTYATLVALEGGITKIGDTFISLSTQQTDVLRRLLPVYDGSARPVDLFEMAFPQVWDLGVSAGGGDWHAVGVFNWGKNRRWGKPGAEAPQTITVRGADLGLEPSATYIAWGYWSGKFLGEFSGGGELDVTLSARTDEVIAIHKKEGAPQFLSTNRHVTQGGTDLISSNWNAADSTLKIAERIDAGFPYELIVYAPEGYTAAQAELGPDKVSFIQDGNIVRVKAAPSASGAAAWTVRFEKK